jgi:hypothetical protein
MDAEEKEPAKMVLLSPLESVAYYLGILKVFTLLENATFSGEDGPPIDWDVLKRRLNGIGKHLGLDEFLHNLDPKEEHLTAAIKERVASERDSFAILEECLVSIRKARGVNVNPPLDNTSNASSESEAGTAHYSTFENFNRLCGMFEVFDFYEQSVTEGALSIQTHWDVVRSLLHPEEFYSIHTFLERLGCLAEVVPADGATGLSPELPKIKPGEKTHTWLVLSNRIRTDEKVFKELRSRFLGRHDEESQRLAWGFVDDFLKTHTFSEPEAKVRELLYLFTKRLGARQEAVERGEDDRFEPIDKNIHHLLDTLKQWGINATTYDEALKGYEQKFRAKVVTPPKDIMEEISKRLKSRVGNATRLMEDRDKQMKEHPAFKDYIEWEYDKEIKRLKSKE